MSDSIALLARVSVFADVSAQADQDRRGRAVFVAAGARDHVEPGLFRAAWSAEQNVER